MSASLEATQSPARPVAGPPHIQGYRLEKLVGKMGVEVRDIQVAEARTCREMLLLGSSIKVAPVILWDDQAIGGGKPGPVSKALTGVDITLNVR